MARKRMFDLEVVPADWNINDNDDWRAFKQARFFSYIFLDVKRLTQNKLDVKFPKIILDFLFILWYIIYIKEKENKK